MEADQAHQGVEAKSSEGWGLVAGLLLVLVVLAAAGVWLYVNKGVLLGFKGVPVEESRLSEYTKPFERQFVKASHDCLKHEYGEKEFLESYKPQLEQRFGQAGGDPDRVIYGEFPNVKCYYMADPDLFVYQRVDGRWIKLILEGKKLKVEEL